jgi:hypothetical protein
MLASHDVVKISAPSWLVLIMARRSGLVGLARGADALYDGLGSINHEFQNERCVNRLFDNALVVETNHAIELTPPGGFAWPWPPLPSRGS